MKNHTQHIEFSGQSGFYTVWGNTKRAQRWIAESVSFESWQGTPADGIAIDDTRMAQQIADAAVDAGFDVAVNGVSYKPIAA